MTPYETISLLRMMLDEGREQYFPLNEVNRVINEAQLAKLREYYIGNDEIALRPLYRETVWLNKPALGGNEILDNNGMTLLYPKSCRIKTDSAYTDDLSVMSTYIEPELYFNNNLPGFRTGDIFPHKSMYTLQREPVAVLGVVVRNLSVLYFQGDMTGAIPQAKMWYVAYTMPFSFSTGGFATNVPLQLPAEYHIEVVTLAAEILNDIDVKEEDRGDVAIEQIGQRINIEETGTVYEPPKRNG